MPAMPVQETVGFSLTLRQATTPDHGAAEGAGFMQALMDGALDATAVAALAGRLLPVYRTLETAITPYAGDPVLGPVLDRGLDRTASLRADLAVLEATEFDSPAVASYVARLLEVSDRPDLLLAHHYTRYLGDLSGGQAIGALIRRHYGLGDAGTSFYAFPAITDPVAYKRVYRAHLDRLPSLGVDEVAFIAEVRTAYAANRGLIDELGAQCLPVR
jgi:heme oxygenase